MTQSATRSGAPERVGRFELLVPIGTGGMATVYLARTRLIADTYRYAALKILHQKLAADDGAGLADLVAEAKLASAIRHPNVVPVLSVEEDEPWVALVMEYIEGETISGLIRAARAKGERIPQPIVGAMIADVLAGLHAAHEATDGGKRLDLVHRDVSPQNVIVGLDGRSRLTDFGIAKIDRTNATATGLVKGKTGYMAPEQIAGLKLTRAVDIWASAVVTWELLAGERLFHGEPMPTMLRIVNEIPARLRTIEPSIPESVDEAVAQALAHDPSKRPATADAFRKILVDAWGNLADPAEVGRYVQALSGEKLDRRRAQTEEILDLRARMTTVTRHAEASARDTSSSKKAPGDLPTRLESGPTTAPGETGFASTGSLRRPGRTRALGLGIAALGVVAFGVWMVTRSGANVAASPTTPAREASSSEAASRIVVFSSKRPIVAVRVAGRTVESPPALTLGVPVPTGAHEAEVVAADGERASVSVPADASQVLVPLEPATSAIEPSASAGAAASARPTGRAPGRLQPPAKATAAPKDPGLAPPPY
ncbi:MAG: serine/threonine protein kinase [Polyangiaceae bacterium]|nr:serine/threonine protein kinase [Polyangiaceae bacterium]